MHALQYRDPLMPNYEELELRDCSLSRERSARRVLSPDAKFHRRVASNVPRAIQRIPRLNSIKIISFGRAIVVIRDKQRASMARLNRSRVITFHDTLLSSALPRTRNVIPSCSVFATLDFSWPSVWGVTAKGKGDGDRKRVERGNTALGGRRAVRNNYL